MARFAMRPAYVGATPARTGGPGTIDYLFAPESTRVWLTHFLLDADRDRVRFTGEGAQTTCDIDDIASGTSDGVVLYSSHETLTRDLAIARVLRERGVRVFCQTPRAARLGTDKYAMKSFFDESGFDTSPWICGDAQWPGSDEDLLVVKHRHGTQSQGIGLRRADDCALGPDQFAELYRDGVEYSVVVYRDDDRCVLFPPV